jgi:hypothetical protein
MSAGGGVALKLPVMEIGTIRLEILFGVVS